MHEVADASDVIAIDEIRRTVDAGKGEVAMMELETSFSDHTFCAGAAEGPRRPRSAWVPGVREPDAQIAARVHGLSESTE